jgi:hypothetical protein
VRERVDAKVDGVETVRDEACTEFTIHRNGSWINAHTGVANTGCMKVGTTMNTRQYLRGSAEKVSETVAVRRAVSRENADAACYCRRRQSSRGGQRRRCGGTGGQGGNAGSLKM